MRITRKMFKKLFKNKKAEQQKKRDEEAAVSPETGNEELDVSRDLPKVAEAPNSVEPQAQESKNIALGEQGHIQKRKDDLKRWDELQSLYGDRAKMQKLNDILVQEKNESEQSLLEAEQNRVRTAKLSVCDVKTKECAYKEETTKALVAEWKKRKKVNKVRRCTCQPWRRPKTEFDVDHHLLYCPQYLSTELEPPVNNPQAVELRGSGNLLPIVTPHSLDPSEERNHPVLEEIKELKVEQKLMKNSLEGCVAQSKEQANEFRSLIRSLTEVQKKVIDKLEELEGEESTGGSTSDSSGNGDVQWWRKIFHWRKWKDMWDDFIEYTWKHKYHFLWHIIIDVVMELVKALV